MSQYENSTTVAEQRQRILRLEVRNSALAADNKSLESEVAALRAERDEHARWRSKLADKLHAAEAELAALKAAQPQGEPVITDAMALAFHRSMTDGDLGHADMEEIKTGLRAAFAAQPERVSVPTGWQPIETAPKGKKLILGYRNDLGKWRTVLGCYWLQDTLESDHTDSGYADEGWYEATEAYEELAPLDCEPTHWMPLPAAAQEGK